MNKKFLFLICLIFSISLSAVSAADDVNHTMGLSQSYGEILESAESGTFSELEEKIINAQNGSIDLDKDYVFDDADGKCINITKDITINGYGHTIDANSSSRIFQMNSNETKVILNNISFINANSYDDVFAIYSNGVLRINNCGFANNIGGAVYSAGDLTVIDSTFTGNLYADAGGAIFSTGSSLIKNSIFTDNFAETGGAIFSSGSLVVISSNFTENCAHWSGGGAIYSSGNLTVNNCNFIENTAPDWDYQGNDGGAIYSVGNLNVSNSNFINNEAGSYYDEWNNAIYAYSAYSSIENCTFVNNSYVLTKMTSYFDLFLNSSTVPVGESIKISAEFENKKIPGNVTIRINDDERPVDIINGSCSFILSDLAAGTYLVTAVYPENEWWWGYSQTVKFNVFDGSYVIDAPYLEKYYGGQERFVVRVCNLDGNEISGEKISITINGKEYFRTTDANGFSSIAANLNSGKHNVTVKYDNSIVNSFITVKSTVNGENVTKMFRNSTQYYAAFVDSSGYALGENTAVEFNINGVFYTRYTNENGVAKMNINLNPGVYVITAKNLLSGEMYTNIVTVLPTIVENYNLTKYFKNNTQYSIRLLDDEGNPVKEGIEVKFNINGVFYTRKSNATGYVNMNINLNPSEYIITAEYNGLRASNSIKVLPTIESKDLSMHYMDGSQFEAKVLDGLGNPNPGVNVTFNINGVFYDRVSDVNGIARLNIKLMAGEYIITSSYNGLNAANKITISG